MAMALDVVLIVIYFIAVAIIGYKSSNRRDAEEYLIAKKSLTVWQNVSTLTSTKITASIILTYVALVYTFGISAIWAFIGTAMGYILFLMFAIMLKKEGDLNNYHSIADYFRHRYGEAVGWLVGIFVFGTIFLNFTVQLIGGGKILNSITGLAFPLSVLLCAGFVLFYLYLGGFRAVVKTDIVQFIAILLLFFILGIFLFGNFTYEASQWAIMSAGPGLIIPLILVGMLFPFSAPDLWQRALAAKNVRSLKKSFLIATVLYIFFGFLLSVIAIIIKLKLPGLDADVALVEGFKQLLPPGLLGAGLVALFAAIMSSADSYAFISAGLLTENILKTKKENSIRNLRWVIIFVIVMGTLASLLFQSIIDASFFLTGIFIVMSVVVLATWIKRKIKKVTLLCGLLVGVIVTFTYTFLFGISPLLIVVGIGGGLIGLGVGVIISKYFY